MSRTMTSRPICTQCAGSGIDPFALPFGNELPDFIATIDDIECLSCGGTGYDPRVLIQHQPTWNFEEQYA